MLNDLRFNTNIDKQNAANADAKGFFGAYSAYEMIDTVDGRDTYVSFNDRFIAKMRIALMEGHLFTMTEPEKKMFYAMVQWQDYQENNSGPTNLMDEFEEIVLIDLNQWLVDEAQDIKHRGAMQYWSEATGWIDPGPSVPGIIVGESTYLTPSWTEVGDRAFGTTYTNNTTKVLEIFVSGECTVAGNSLLIGNVGGVEIGSSSTVDEAGQIATIRYTVPAGETYKITTSGSVSLIKWYELIYS